MYTLELTQKQPSIIIAICFAADAIQNRAQWGLTSHVGLLDK